ncbi:hypothetical protein ABZ826_23865 [Streptomyces sp. NPDC047515]|uniref:hypothetical protein n=1 Tax=Streptomyces sp. NPDC047515 TaxID=3155380 RepID=UPI0033D34512
MDAAVRAWLASELGKDSDFTDLEVRYTRLGTARAVALEVVRERLAALRSQPSTVNVSSVVSVSYIENIKAYERQIALLEDGQPPAPDDPDDGESSDGFGVMFLVERPRR